MQSYLSVDLAESWVAPMLSWLFLVRVKTDIVIALVARYGINGSIFALGVALCVVVTRHLYPITGGHIRNVQLAFS